jgi:hypothetical protein
MNKSKLGRIGEKTMTKELSLRPRLLVLSLMLALLTVLGSTNSRAQTPKPGWASLTGFRNAETSVQRAVRDAGFRANGLPSGQSTTNGSWETDTAGGDGARMRAAINRYQNWYWTNSTRRPTIDQIKTQMMGDFGGSAYDQPRRSMLVNQIVDRYNAAVRLGPVRVPTTDNDTLYFLGIRKQCLEWAMSTAISVGGQSRNYYAAGVTDPRAFRPGMGLYKLDHSHAMIIVDIRWDASGNPAELKVAESNYGGGWQNPGGMVPWQRTIDIRSGISFNSGVYKVVSY